MKTIGIVIFLFSPCFLFSQKMMSVQLSSKHEKQLSAISSGHKRLKRFYTYYKKDSTLYYKNQNRTYKRAIDSLYRSKKQKGLLARPGIADEGDNEFLENFHKWNLIYKDSTVLDSLKQLAQEHLKELTAEKVKQCLSIQIAMERYQVGYDSTTWKDLVSYAPGLDTLSNLFHSSSNELYTAGEKSAQRLLLKESSAAKLSESTQSLEQLKSLRAGYEQQYKQYTNKESLEQQGKDKAAEKALDYFAQHEKELDAAQKKVSKLLGKYREFANSEKLDDAVKHTSMKDKIFKERLMIGGNFNVISTDAFSIDLSPQIGYKFTTKLFVGVGISYRLSFGDSIKNHRYVSPSNTSFEMFASYDLIKSFYAYAEWKKSGVKINSEPAVNRWRDNYFVGVGKRFLIHPKLYLTLTALYNLNNTDNNPVYPRRFQIRAGFQLSELATRKKKVYYDPNR